MLNLLFRATIAGGIALLLSVSSAAAADYYVSPSGSDSNSGTQSAPFRTLNRAVGFLRAGDTLFVRAGVYNEALLGVIRGGNDWNSPVTVRAYPGERPILRPNGTLNVMRFAYYVGIRGSDQHHIIIDGLVLDGANVNNDCLKISEGAHHIRIMNCEVMNAPNQGILVADSPSANNEFINLDVHDNGVNDFCHGIYIKTSNNVVDGGRYYRNAGWGVHIYNGNLSDDGPCDNNTVRNVRAYDNGTKGRGVGIGLYSGKNHKAYNNLCWNNVSGIVLDYHASGCSVFNNTIFRNRSTGIQQAEQGSGTKIYNNLLAENGHIGIYISPGSQGADVRNNLFYRNAAGQSQLSDDIKNFYDFDRRAATSGNLGAGSFPGPDPRLVNIGGLDVRPTSSSPAIGAGLSLGEVTTDLDGKGRPNGSAYTIGAFEPGGGAPPPPPPPPNNAPTADGKSVTTNEDAPVNVVLSGSDPEGTALRFTVTSDPSNGRLSGTAPNLTYTPNAGFSGTDRFSYKTSDGNLDSSTATVVITVNAQNDRPAAQGRSLATIEGRALSFTLAGSDPDGDELRYIVVTEPAHGTLSGNPPSLSYLSDAGFSGSDQFTFKVTDGDLESPAVAVVITVSPSNTAPVAQSLTIATRAGTPVAVTLRGTDAEGDALAFALLSQPTHGTLSGSGANLTFAPAPDFSGTDGFAYKVSDGRLDSAPATVTINVAAGNSAPTATAQSLTTGAGASLPFVLSGSDPDGDGIVFLTVRPPIHGTLSGTAPNLVYTPSPGYSGSDSFAFKVNDGQVDSATATVSFTINAPAPEPPPAEPATYYVATTGNDASDGTAAAPFRTLNRAVRALAVGDTLVVHGGTYSESLIGAIPGGASWDKPVTVRSASGSKPVLRPPAGTTRVLHFGLGGPATSSSQHHIIIDGLALDAVNASSDAVKITDGAHHIRLQNCEILNAGNQGILVTDAASTHNEFINLDVHHNGRSLPDRHGIFLTTSNNRVSRCRIHDNSGIGILVEGSASDAAVLEANEIYANGTQSGTAGIALLGGSGHTIVNNTLWNNLAGILVDAASEITLAHNTLHANRAGGIEISSNASSCAIVNNLLSSNTGVGLAVVAGATDVNVHHNLFYSNAAGVSTPAAEKNFSNSAGATASQNLGLIFPGANPAFLNATSPDLRLRWPSPAVDAGAVLAQVPVDAAGIGRPRNGATTIGAFEFTGDRTAPPSNAPPAATAQTLNGTEDTALKITLTGSDPDGDTLGFFVVTPPAHGTLSGIAPNLTYSPKADFGGTDSFTFKVSDGSADSASATIAISVAAVNDAPVATAQALNATEDTSLKITLAGSDPEGKTLSFAIVTPPAQGTLSGTAPNLTYIPKANFNGTDSFTFKANDGSLDSAPATVAISVTAVNDAPVAQAKSLTTPESKPLSLVLTGSDADGGTLRFTVTANPAHGSLSGTAPNLTYTPVAGYSGADSLSFKVGDGSAESAPAVISINVTDVNNVPVAKAQSLSGAEDAALKITLTGSDADGDTLSFSIVTAPAQGALSGAAPNLTYTPKANFNGADSFSFKVNDGSLDSAPATVAISIAAVNDAPVATAQSLNATEDTSLKITLAGSDPEGKPLTFAIVTPPARGVISGAAPNLTYIPKANLNGNDSFTFKVNDGLLDSAPATVAIGVAAVNDTPVAQAKSLTTPESKPLSLVLTGSDVDGDTLRFTVTANPAHGSLTGTAPNLTYTPVAGYSGADSLSFKVGDGSVESTSAVISINVTDVNNVPVAKAQSLSGAEDAALKITLTGSDADGDTLSFSIVTAPAQGALSGAAPNLTYTPKANFNGADSFSFKVNDGTLDSATATVAISIAAVNDAPVATAQSVKATEDTALKLTLAGSDPEGKTLTFAIVTPPAQGALAGAAPNLTYIPKANFKGADSFTFKVNDGSLDSAPATVAISVAAVNDPPVAHAKALTTPEGKPLNLVLTGSDVDGDTLRFTVAANPAHGSLTGTAPNLTYTPAAGYNGADSLSFKVGDGSAESAPAVISINVTDVNNAPVAKAQSLNGAEDAALQITLSGSDADGDTLSFSIVTGPARGTLSGTAPNLTYTPKANVNGADSFTFKVNDGSLDSAAAIVVISVAAINDVPTAKASAVTTDEDTPVSLSLEASDVDGDALTYWIVAAPRHGRLSGKAPQLIYTPAVDFSGTDHLTFRVNDGKADSAQVTVTITVRDALDPVLVEAPPIRTQIESDPNGQEYLRLHVDGVAGVIIHLDVSSDLVQWSRLTTSAAGRAVDFVDPQDNADNASRFYRSVLDVIETPAGTAPRVFSVNAIGCIRRTMQPGLVAFANPLVVGDCSVAALLPSVPEGTSIYTLRDGEYVVNTFEFGAWSNPSQKLVPGDGAFFQYDGPQPLKLTTIGKVFQGRHSVSIPLGLSLQSSPVPQAGMLDLDLGFPFDNGDVVYRFNPVDGGYLTYTFENGAWDTVPTVNIGESFFVNKTTARTWTREFSVAP